jgi:hypothetical protein
MNKLTIVGLTLVFISALIRLAQTLYMPGILENTRVGPADPMLVPLGIAIFVSYLLLPLGIILCAIGLLTRTKRNQDWNPTSQHQPASTHTSSESRDSLLPKP